MNRRGNHQGSVYQRGSDGKWIAAITWRDHNGKRRSKTRTCSKKSDAQRELRNLLRFADEGAIPSDGRLTVRQWLDHWLENVIRPSRKPRTYEGYEGIVRVHLDPAFGGKALDKLSVEDVERMLTGKSQELSSARVQRIRAALRSALSEALRRGHVRQNVAQLARGPREERRQAKWMDKTRVAKFFEAARGERLEALFVTAALVGMRQGELLGLRWEDVDLDGGMLSVTGSLENVRGQKRRVSSAKTESSIRKLNLPVSVVEHLRRHRTAQMRERPAAGDRWQEHGLVFATSIGTPLDGSNVSGRDLKRILKRAGLEDLRFHDLRHTCGALMILSGASLFEVQKTLGHKNISTTANIYGHLAPAAQRKAVNRLDEFMRGAV